MKLFNSIQIVALFVAWPFLLNWLHTADFPAATSAFVISCVLYLIGFVLMVVAVRTAIGEWDA